MVLDGEREREREREREISRMQIKMGGVSHRKCESREQNKYAKHCPSTENW